MKYYTIAELAQIVKGALTEKVDSSISHLLIDSRLLSLPEESLFFAIKQVRDGHDFVEKLYQKGVKNFVVTEFREEFTHYEANFIVVPDSLAALQAIGAAHRSSFQLPVYGITGSNGKTITKEWLYQCLEQELHVVRNPKSYNSQYGVPLSVWHLHEKHQVGIFEAGISKPNEMSKLAKIIQPEIGIFTYLGDAHQSNFDSKEEKLLEKLQLFKHAKTLIYNRDELEVDEAVQELYADKELFTWSYMSDSTVRVEKIFKLNHHSLLRYAYRGAKYDLRIPFQDDASICNSMCVLCALLHRRLSFEDIQACIMKLHPVAMRLEVKQGQHNCLIVNDYYNSDINSLNIALSFTASNAQHEKKTLILSDIFQSDLEPDQLYVQVRQMMQQYGFQKLIGVGTEITKYKSLFEELDSTFFNSTEALLLHIQKSKQFKNQTVLLKASRVFKFEKLAAVLEQRQHQTVMEINLNAMAKNFNYFKSQLKPSTEIMVMVKAYSYGTGSYEIAKLLQSQGADYLAVAFADEGAELRESGITMPIVVMNPEKHSFYSIVEHKLEPEIYNFKILHEFVSFLKENAIKLYPIHLKIDSGMNRSGFYEHEMPQLAEKLLQHTEVYISSVFSHLSGADSAEFDAFSNEQIQRFTKASEQLQSLTEYSFKRHILNSAGISRFVDAQFELVRLGLGLYGVGIPENAKKIENVCSLRTTINQIRTVKSGETVGYNRSGKILKESRVAVLPVGYADGLNRKLGNGNYSMLVHGKPAPTVGNICMDMCMLDVSHIPETQEGDSVLIFGDEQPVSTLANCLDTIPYEVLTGISRRVKRVYYK